MILYRVKGWKEEHSGYTWNEGSGDSEPTITRVKHTYFLNAKSFQNATTKAKKLLDYTEEVREMIGEIVEVD